VWQHCLPKNLVPDLHFKRKSEKDNELSVDLRIHIVILRTKMKNFGIEKTINSVTFDYKVIANLQHFKQLQFFISSFG
jgi:hypothetical protein